MKHHKQHDDSAALHESVPAPFFHDWQQRKLANDIAALAATVNGRRMCGR